MEETTTQTPAVTKLNFDAEQNMAPAVAGNMYLNPQVFEHVQRVSKVFAASKLVPTQYQNNLADCVIAIEMASRLDVHPMMFMQSSYIVHGKPSITGQFVIALVNKRGPYKTGVSFKYERDKDGTPKSCTAYGIRKDTGEVQETTVTVEQAKAMGWWNKNPIWQTMTEQMLTYRAASWLARRYCPDVLMGLQSKEELLDVIEGEVIDSAKSLNEEIGSTNRASN